MILSATHRLNVIIFHLVEMCSSSLPIKMNCHDANLPSNLQMNLFSVPV